MEPKSNGSRLEESAALLQQAMSSLMQTQSTLMQNQSTLMQNQAIFLQNHAPLVSRIDRLEEKMDRRFAEVDRRFEQIDHRFEHIESLLTKMFAELPERVFGFGQAAAKKQPGSSNTSDSVRRGSKAPRFPIVRLMPCVAAVPPSDQFHSSRKSTFGLLCTMRL
jgi:hypothetical protein